MHTLRHVKGEAVAEVGIVKWDARFTTRPFRPVKYKLIAAYGHSWHVLEPLFDV